MGFTKPHASKKIFHCTSKEEMIEQARKVRHTILPLQFLVYKRMLTYMGHSNFIQNN
jgi:hypothetical protein